MITETDVWAKHAQIKKSAKKRGKDFNLTFEYVKNLMEQTHCAYSGLPFSSKKGENMSFERWDNQFGYVCGNVIPVMVKYNAFRGDKELETLIADRHTDYVESSFVMNNAFRELIHQQKLMISACKQSMATRYKKMAYIKQHLDAICQRQANRKECLPYQSPERHAALLEKILNTELVRRDQQSAYDKNLSEIKQYQEQIERALTIIFTLKDNPKIALSRRQAKNRVQKYDIIIPRIERLFQASHSERFNLERGLPMDTKFCFWEMLCVKFGIIFK